MSQECFVEAGIVNVKVDISYEERCQKLRELLEAETRQDCLVAFSGGVDSSVLLKLACEAAALQGTTVHAVTLQSELHPLGDLEISRQVAQEIGAQHHVLEIRELQEADILDNPVDRCYRCKKYLFGQAMELGRKLGVTTVLEGTNADDLLVYRPGIRAVRELGVHSPMAEAGLTKAQVRQLAGELGLSVAHRPSTPCLATRFPYGARLTQEDMDRVGAGEELLRQMGYQDVRIRVHGSVARLELSVEEFPRLLQEREQVVEQLKALGYPYVTLDLQGFRSGSMDEVLGNDLNSD